MLRVRFFGILRLDLGIKEMFVEATNVRELLHAVAEKSNGKFNDKDLKGYLIYVNGTLTTKLKGFRTKLSDGDDIIMMNPSSGG